MATLEQENEQREALSKILREIIEIEPEDLVREDVLGRELSFAAGLPYFERTLRFCRDLSESNLDTIPSSRLNQLINASQQALNQFKQVQAFSVQQHPENPAQARDNFIAQIRDSYDKYFEQVSPVIAYSVRKGTDFERLENEARQTVENLKSIVGGQEASRSAMLGEIEGTLEKVRRAAQEVGVAQHNVHFKQEADDHKNIATKWLGATAILGLITVLFGVVSLYYFISLVPTLTPSQSIQIGVAKLIVFSVLFSALIWMGRIYRANRHNYIVNKHRQNALSTFEAFVKATSDDQTKSAVLLQATQCIFSPQHSGYVPQERDSGTHPPVLEIIRGIAGTQEKP